MNKTHPWFALFTALMIAGLCGSVSPVGCKKKDEPVAPPPPSSQPAVAEAPRATEPGVAKSVDGAVSFEGPSTQSSPSTEASRTEWVGHDPNIPRVEFGGLSEADQQAVREAYEKAVQSPDDLQSVGHLAMIYCRLAFPVAAIPLLQKCSQIDPDELRWPYFLGIAFEGAFEPQKAAEAFRVALKINPDYSPAKVRLAELLLATDPKKAKDLFSEAMIQTPGDSEALCGMGRCALLDKDWESAIRFFQDAIARSPEYDQAHRGLAVALRATGQPERAGDHESSALAGGRPISANDPLYVDLMTLGIRAEAMLVVAQELVAQGNLELARRVVERAMATGDSLSSCHRAMGDLSLWQGHMDEAQKQYELALKAGPHESAPRLSLASMMITMRRYAEADALLKEAFRIDAGNPDVLRAYGKFLVQVHRPGEALPIQLKLCSIVPSDIAAQIDLIVTYVNAAKFNDAIRQYKISSAGHLVPASFLDEIVVRLVALMADQRRIPVTTQPLGKESLTPAHLDRWADQLLAARLEEESSKIRHYLDSVAAYELTLAQKGDLNAAVIVAQLTLPADRGGILRDGAVRLYAIMKDKTPQAARDFLGNAAQQSMTTPSLGNLVAWILATCPDDSQRHGGDAVKLARIACEAAQNGNAEFLDTLAAAYAEERQFDQAVEMIRKALDVAEKRMDVLAQERFRGRLKLYESKQPYRVR